MVPTRAGRPGAGCSSFCTGFGGRFLRECAWPQHRGAPGLLQHLGRAQEQGELGGGTAHRPFLGAAGRWEAAALSPSFQQREQTDPEAVGPGS